MNKFDKMYNGSWYTITGTGGDLNEWKDGYQGLLNELGIGKIKEWETFSGKDMNDEYGLHGDVAYKDDLTFLSFSIEGLDTPKLAFFKLNMGDRWFDDIVENNLFHMNNYAERS